MAIGFIHPSELLIFKRLPSYQMNSRPTARWWSAPCHLAAECSPSFVAVALRSVRLCRYDLLADTG